MKQKYALVRDDAANELIMREYAELDKEILSLICEERFNADTVKAAMGKDRDALMASLRSLNMYPPGVYLEQLAESVKKLYAADTENSVELYFNDLDFLARQTKEAAETSTSEDIEEASEDIDDLLDDDIEDSFDDKSNISNIGANSPLKIAEDDMLDVEDES